MKFKRKVANNEVTNIIASGIITQSHSNSVFLNGRIYELQRPSIMLVTKALGVIDTEKIKEGSTIGDVLVNSASYNDYSKALSYMIAGDESLSGELLKASHSEIISAMGVLFKHVNLLEILKKHYRVIKTAESIMNNIVCRQ